LEWTWRWLLNLNTKKCFAVSFGRDVNNDFKYIIPHKDQQFVPIERGDTVRDLGVTFDEKLTFREHIQHKINMAYKMVGLYQK